MLTTVGVYEQCKADVRKMGIGQLQCSEPYGGPAVMAGRTPGRAVRHIPVWGEFPGGLPEFAWPPGPTGSAFTISSDSHRAGRWEGRG